MKSVSRIIVLNILLVTQVYAQTPDWIQETGRMIRGGDIVHFGMGRATTAELANFKAKQSAISAIIDECGGVANKAIVPRKQHVERDEGGFVAYAHVSIDFDACDHAKSRLTRRDEIENKQIAEDQKLYRQLLTGPKDDGLEAKIRRIMAVETKRIIASIPDHSEKLESISEQLSEIKEMMARPAPAPVAAPVRAVSGMASAKALCQQQARRLMNQATLLAADHYGNMADPSVSPAYNMAMQQQSMCEGMN